MERHPFTLAITAGLEAAGFPVGVAERPDGGGWEGEPNTPLAGLFRPYVVVVPLTASTSSGPMAVDSQGDWRLPYSVTSYAIRGDQVERIADRVRAVVLALSRAAVTTSGGGYRVVKVNLSAIGQVNRADQTDPPFYAQTDSVELWANKEPT